MEFDFDLIAAPFRMQPGLRRPAPGTRHLTPLAQDTPLWREKKLVFDAGQSRHAVPGFDAAPALRAIAAQAGAPAEAFLHGGMPLELAFEEDVAVLDGADGTLPWLCVCVPSHWAPEDKVGLPLAAVHAPVADNATLVAASQHLVQLATGGEAWERFVWTVTPSPRHDQHPRRHARTPWPDTIDTAGAAAFARQCFLRVERQAFFPAGQGTRQAVFTIRVMLQPLAEAVRGPTEAKRLHDTLASMSPAVLAYKGLADAQAPLLRWLAEGAD